MNLIKNSLYYCFCFCALFLVSCATGSKHSTKDIPTVDEVDLNKYAGKWYEIARLPHRFEKDLVNVTATYELLPDGKIKVLNEGYKKTADGKHKTAKGKAWRPDPKVPGVLKVSFFWPFSGSYRIIDLDKKDYSYSVVTSDTKKYLWLLCRNPEMDSELYDKLVRRLLVLSLSKESKDGFDISKLIKVTQVWEK